MAERISGGSASGHDATETKLDSILAELQLKADLAETQPVSGPLTDAQLRASAVPVSGPLTDAQLRAAAVPISAAALPLPTGAATAANQQTNALTDAQLRAAAVPVSGPLTDAQLRATPVPVSIPGAVPVTDNGGSLTVDGPLTDAQLRAAAVPISAASLPLPTGAATATGITSVRDRLPSALVGGRLDANLGAVDGKAAVYSTERLTANGTTTLTSADAYLATVILLVEGDGTASTLKVQDKSVSPRILLNVQTTAVGNTPTLVALTVPVKMLGGIDIVTAGTTAATVSIWVTWYA